jgi:hypothetical protein
MDESEMPELHRVLDDRPMLRLEATPCESATERHEEGCEADGRCHRRTTPVIPPEISAATSAITRGSARPPGAAR